MSLSPRCKAIQEWHETLGGDGQTWEMPVPYNIRLSSKRELKT